MFSNNLLENTFAFLINDFIVKYHIFCDEKRFLLLKLGESSQYETNEKIQLFINFNDILYKIYLSCYKIYSQFLIMHSVLSEIETNINIDIFKLDVNFSNQMFDVLIYLKKILYNCKNVERIFGDVKLQCDDLETYFNQINFDCNNFKHFDLYGILKYKKIHNLNIIEEINYFKNLVLEIDTIQTSIIMEHTEIVHLEYQKIKQKKQNKIIIIIVPILILLFILFIWLSYMIIEY